MTSAPLRELVPVVMLTGTGICLGSALRRWEPILSIRWVHRPYRVPPSLHNGLLWCRTCHLLAIAYDGDVLGLGPD